MEPQRIMTRLRIAVALVIAAAVIVVAALLLSGGGDDGGDSAAENSGVVATTAASASNDTLPNGSPLFDGYPRLVDADEVDERVVGANEGVEQFVALAPAVWAIYDPANPDLLSYLSGPTTGDCVMRATYFPDSDGECFDR